MSSSATVLFAQGVFPERVRATSWCYDSNVTTETATAKAKSLWENGYNLLLTEGHRYLFPVTQKEIDADEDFLFKRYPTEESERATSVVVSAMHEYGIKVLHHVTAAYCSKLEMQKHPDWCQESVMDPGKPVYFTDYGGVYLWCLNNPGFRDAYFKRACELQKKMDFDAWMIDEVEWLPNWFVCGCKHCRDKFKAETGYNLPVNMDSPVWANYDDPVWRAWLEARMRWSGEFFKDLRAHMKEEGLRDVPFTACHAGITSSWSAQYWGIDAIDLTLGTNWVFYEVFVNNSAPYYSWKRNIAEIEVYDATARAKTDYNTFVLFYPAGEKKEYSWCWAATYTLNDTLWSTTSTLEEYKWDRRHEFLNYPHASDVADYGLVFSKPGRDFTRMTTDTKLLNETNSNFNAGYINEFCSWTCALISTNLPHNVILDDAITTNLLKKYKVILLPSTTYLDDGQVAALLQYAKDGGKLVISGTPAKYDRKGTPRPDDTATKSLLSAAAVVIDAKRAENALPKYVIRDVPFEGQPDAADVAYLEDSLRSVISKEKLSFITESTSSVFVKAWENETKSRMKVNILNCSGADLDKGEVLTLGYKINMPPNHVSLKINAELAGDPRYMVLYDPYTSSSKVIEPQRDGDFYKVELDATNPLCVLEWEKHPLSKDINWTRTQNANWYVLGTELTPVQADASAEKMHQDGINMLLTDKHRYIIYDVDEFDQHTSIPFENIWEGRPLRLSSELTRNLVDACHKRDMRVVWHTTYCMASRDFILQHPSWAQCDLREPDKPAYFEMYGGNWNLCLNNPEARQAYYKRVADLTRETGVDGWMIDEVEWLPDWFICGCKVCIEKFKKDTGWDMPTGKKTSKLYGNFNDPLWRAWIAWRMKCVGDFFKDLRAYMDNEGLKDLVYTCCHAGVADTWSGQVWGIDEFELAKGMNMCFYEAYIKDGAPYYGWKRHLEEMDIYGAIARNRTPGIPNLSLFYPNTKEESSFVTALTYLAGNRPWVSYSDGVTQFSMTQWEADHKQLQRSGEENMVANVGIYFSKATRDFFGNDPKQENNSFYVNHFSNWNVALYEKNIPVQTIISDDVENAKLAQYDVLVFPMAKALSDKELSELNNWISGKDKKLIIYGDFAQCDETGEPVQRQLAEDLKNKAYKVMPAFKDVPAHKANYAIHDKVWLNGFPQKDRDVVNELLDQLQYMYLWKADTDATKVAIRIWELPDGRLMVHLLNVSGCGLKDGDIFHKPPKGEEYVTWNELDPIKIDIAESALPAELRKKDVHARMNAFSGSPKVELMTLPNGAIQLNISKLKDYAIVELAN